MFDVQTSDNMDAVLLVIAQTFMDACTLADHKLGRVSAVFSGQGKGLKQDPDCLGLCATWKVVRPQCAGCSEAGTSVPTHSR